MNHDYTCQNVYTRDVSHIIQHKPDKGCISQRLSLKVVCQTRLIKLCVQKASKYRAFNFFFAQAFVNERDNTDRNKRHGLLNVTTVRDGEKNQCNYTSVLVHNN